MYRIGEFSKLVKTTVKTLRFYDEAGLLPPAGTDEFTGYRMYTTEQFVKLHKIQCYRQAGLSIDEIKSIFVGREEREILLNRKSELLNIQNDTEARLSQLEFILTHKESYMNYSATLKKTDKCIVYYTRFTLKNYSEYNTIIPAIGEKVMKKYPKLKCASPEYCFVRYLDNEYRETDINVEFCEAVDKLMPDFDDIKFKVMESVEVLSVMHKGPYTRLTEAYGYAMKWMESNNYVPSESFRESYIDGIWNKESEEEWLTEIQIPVIKINR